MTTTKSSVYKTHQIAPNDDQPSQQQRKTMTEKQLDEHHVPVDVVHIRNHSFDVDERQRKPKQKSSTVHRFHDLSRGNRPVGQYHRRDESKIMPHKRSNLPDSVLDR